MIFFPRTVLVWEYTCTFGSAKDEELKQLSKWEKRTNVLCESDNHIDILKDCVFMYMCIGMSYFPFLFFTEASEGEAREVWSFR